MKEREREGGESVLVRDERLKKKTLVREIERKGRQSEYMKVCL